MNSAQYGWATAHKQAADREKWKEMAAALQDTTRRAGKQLLGRSPAADMAERIFSTQSEHRHGRLKPSMFHIFQVSPACTLLLQHELVTHSLSVYLVIKYTTGGSRDVFKLQQSLRTRHHLLRSLNAVDRNSG